MKTPTEIILRSCLEKKSMSKFEADKVIDYYAARNRIMFYYKCDFCNRYHISKNSETTKSLQIIGGKDIYKQEEV